MRTKTDIRFDVGADPSQVLDALMAVEMLPEWSTSCADARVASRDAYGRPGRVFVKSTMMNTSDLQVLEYEWDRDRSSWEITDSTRGVKGSGFFEVSGGDDSTHVWYHTEIYLPIPAPGFLLKRTVRRNNENAVQNFIEFAKQFPEMEKPQIV